MSDTTKRPTTVLGLVLVAALLALTACSGGGDSEQSGDSASQEPSSESPSAEGDAPTPDLEGIPDVVAEVNGEDVTKDEFVATYEAQFQQAAMQAQMSGQAPDEEALKKQVADGLVDTELLRQEAEERGVSVSDEDVDAKLTELAQQNQIESADAFLEALAEQGVTEEQARTQLETQVLVEGLVEDESGEIKPSEKDLRALYQRTKQQQEQAGQQAGQKIPPYDQVKTQLEEQAVAEEQGRIAQQLVDDLREDADITINL